MTKENIIPSLWATKWINDSTKLKIKGKHNGFLWEYGGTGPSTASATGGLAGIYLNYEGCANRLQSTAVIGHYIVTYIFAPNPPVTIGWGHYLYLHYGITLPFLKLFWRSVCFNTFRYLPLPFPGGGEEHGRLVYIKYTWSIGNCAPWCNIPAPSSCRSLVAFNLGLYRLEKGHYMPVLCSHP